MLLTTAKTSLVRKFETRTLQPPMLIVLVVKLCHRQCKNCGGLVRDGEASFVKYDDNDLAEDKEL